MKRRDGPSPASPSQPRSFSLRAVKLAKVGVLAFLVVQALFLDLLPMTVDSLAWRTVGGLLFFVGLATAVAGRWQLGDNWVDLEDYQVLPEQGVVARGLYRYIRHPIYTGDLLLLAGLELALNSWLLFGVAIPAFVVIRQARAEEVLLSSRLKGYDAYCLTTKRFIPFVV